MAGPPWQQTADLKDILVSQARRFPYQQAVRLLHLLLEHEAGGILSDEERSRSVRTRPELSLSFSSSDIAAIDAVEEEPSRFQLTATFLGLYGASSPLPTFYTEELLDEWREGQDLSRRFFDVLNTGLYDLFFRGWAKYQLAYQLHERQNAETRERLFALLGLPEQVWRDRVRHPVRLLRYIGLTTQAPHSAAGLQAMIRDFLDSDQVEVRQCVQRLVAIPVQQRLLLGQQGHSLGEDTVLGQEMAERGGKFQLHIEAHTAEQFHDLLPDRPAFAEVVQLVRFYVDRPLAWDMVLSLPARDVQAVTLGGRQWSRLGWNTWLQTESSSSAQPLAVTLAGPEIGAHTPSDSVHSHR
ncbi:type VI secretion system baseplate subunit TssG [Desulfobulbus elongatus]|uniref:type VI secretion system baseplate subunit TssG n=1 Tax=Desulfobulbus elongatus TaxID=53332 RepID=UPI000686DF21|nr:type VI secretion system baseplate subunit TssG [Desulfobulbus elongatus]